MSVNALRDPQTTEADLCADRARVVALQALRRADDYLTRYEQAGPVYHRAYGWLTRQPDAWFADKESFAGWELLDRALSEMLREVEQR